MSVPFLVDPPVSLLPTDYPLWYASSSQKQSELTSSSFPALESPSQTDDVRVVDLSPKESRFQPQQQQQQTSFPVGIPSSADANHLHKLSVKELRDLCRSKGL